MPLNNGARVWREFLDQQPSVSFAKARDGATDARSATVRPGGSQQGVLLHHKANCCYDVRMKVSELLRLLHDDGWYLVATRGSHRQFKHPTKLGRVTVAGKPGDDLAPGTLNSIFKQASLRQ